LHPESERPSVDGDPRPDDGLIGLA